MSIGAGKRRTRKARKRFDHGEPISRIDTRPMAILLTCMVAFFITFQQVQPHAVTIELWDGRADHPLLDQTEIEGIQGNSIVNRITIDANDAIRWNGELVNMSEMLTLIHEVRMMTPQPVIEFEPAPNASYELSAKALQVLRMSGSAFRIAGTEKYCHFGSDWPPRSSEARPRGSLMLASSIRYDPETELEPRHEITSGEPCEPRYIIHDPH